MNEVYASDLIEMLEEKMKEHGDCVVRIEQDPRGIVAPNEIALYDQEGDLVNENALPGQVVEFFIQ
jgi:hypothetical protein